jgi:DNA polymerase III epsilon subunit-like protein
MDYFGQREKQLHDDSVITSFDSDDDEDEDKDSPVGVVRDELIGCDDDFESTPIQDYDPLDQLDLDDLLQSFPDEDDNHNDDEQDDENHNDDEQDDENHNDEEQAGKEVEERPKKKPNIVPVVDDAGKRVYIVFDIETTGSNRCVDRIIEIGAIAVSEKGYMHAQSFYSRISNAGRLIGRHAYKVHGITEKALRKCEGFAVVGKKFIDWMATQLGPQDTGILVAHNGCCDYQFLACECIRFKMELPEKVKFTLDTYRNVARFKKLDYHTSKDWPKLTPAGKNCVSVGCIVKYLLQRPERILLHGDSLDLGSGARTFQQVCGTAHNGLADAIGAAIILMDKEGIITKDSLGLCKEYVDVLNAMNAKMANALVHEPVSPPWIEYDNGTEPECAKAMPPHNYPADKLPGVTRDLKDHVGNVQLMDPILLLLKVFFYYFTDALLDHIVTCTNAYATQPTVKIGDYKGPPRTQDEQEQVRNRCKKWKPLTRWELIVVLGCILKMGVVNWKRNFHYWSNEPGWPGPDHEISRAIKQERYEEVIANLSFLLPGDDTSYPGDKARKIRFVNDYLLERVQKGFNPEQEFVVDESMIALFSKFCGFLQIMMSKPIKCGVKVFCLVFCASKYLWNWEIYLGKNLDADGPFVYTLIYHKLAPRTWDNTGKVGYTDNYFVSIILFRDLLRRGIFMVGPSKATRPAKVINRTQNSWPIQSYQKGTDSILVGGKGWMRHCYQIVTNTAGTTIGALHASVWLDSKFLFVLSTVHITATKATDTVLRWSRADWRRNRVVAPLAIMMYQARMGAVDYMDKVVSFARIRLKRCKKRYHRAIFLWHLSVVGFHNTKIVWEILLGEEVVKELKKKHGRFGFSHWVQKELANGLIVYGTRMAIQAEILSSIAERAATPTSGSNSPTSVAHTFPATPTRVVRTVPTRTPQVRTRMMRIGFV